MAPHIVAILGALSLHCGIEYSLNLNAFIEYTKDKRV